MSIRVVIWHRGRKISFYRLRRVTAEVAQNVITKLRWVGYCFIDTETKMTKEKFFRNEICYG